MLRLAIILLVAVVFAFPAAMIVSADNSNGYSAVKKDGPRPGQEWPFSYPYYGSGLCTLKCGDMLKVCKSYAKNAWGVGDCRQRHSVCESDCSISDGPGFRRP